ncbi:sigma-54 interaction domain-containing protein [Proteocatella sphenisci]|uniref:sigma-54 interaction domain-containing protein n=1 Tax=Proteocatella sphenisci TaxID=181070 RepID=UPI00048D34D6|nr:sigma-54-dependent Fis family transcriptional regulator [Proteocatella sphenisci]
MYLMPKIFSDKGYIDGITVIDTEGEILFTAKLNKKLNEAREGDEEVVGKRLFEIYNNLNRESSTMFKAMELGSPLYIENQVLEFGSGQETEITSLSIPIKSKDKIVGCIDLSVSEGINEECVEVIKLDSTIFEEIDIEKLSKSKTSAKYCIEHIIGVDSTMLEAKKYIKVAAGCDLAVMIYGETGTGKELFAQAIHNASGRKERPFIAQNCAAIPEGLMEGLLFGTVKGSFTGAIDSPGLLEMAEGGTVFFDEINSMPVTLQAKLLRVIQDREYRALGGSEIKKLDVKIISAINKRPVKAMADGDIRNDLYYRLSQLNIDIPPLKERKEDIPLFINYYIAKYNGIFGKKIKYISRKFYEKTIEHDWPGNVRELENAVVQAMSNMDSSKEIMEFEDVERRIMGGHDLVSASVIEKSLRDIVGDYEKGIIQNIMEMCDYNISKAAKMLQIPRQTLQRKAKSFDII